MSHIKAERREKIVTNNRKMIVQNRSIFKLLQLKQERIKKLITKCDTNKKNIK